MGRKSSADLQSEKLAKELSRIQPLNAKAIEAAKRRQGRLTKPPGSLGRLEELSIQLAGIYGDEKPQVRRKTVIVAAGDHGVVAQGVTAYPQVITGQMVLNFLSGGAAVSVMAKHAGVRLVVVDAGVVSDIPDHPWLKRVSIGKGTKDIAVGPAMTRAQAEACLLAGIDLAKKAIEEGADILGTGDMGIGNTTPSSAITSVISGKSPAITTGKGTGRTLAELKAKATVVKKALAVNKPNPKDGIDVLAKVGGFEIGVLAGVVLGAAIEKRPLVLDGFISGAAGLIACTISPTAKDYCIASHRSAEQGHIVMLQHLGIKPLLDLEMRLGEGTAAVLAMGIIEAAAACLREMATFQEAGVSNKS